MYTFLVWLPLGIVVKPCVGSGTCDTPERETPARPVCWRLTLCKKKQLEREQRSLKLDWRSLDLGRFRSAVRKIADALQEFCIVRSLADARDRGRGDGPQRTGRPRAYRRDGPERPVRGFWGASGTASVQGCAGLSRGTPSHTCGRFPQLFKRTIPPAWN
jgi:hypothetical protein